MSNKELLKLYINEPIGIENILILKQNRKNSLVKLRVYTNQMMDDLKIKVKKFGQNSLTMVVSIYIT